MTTIPRESIDDPRPIPAIQLFVGIDIAKQKHVAGFISPALLAQHKRFTKCPTMNVHNSRTGFEALVQTMKGYASLDRCAVLIEHTGHYGAALKQYLHEQNIVVYEMHAAKRMSKEKTDKRDSLNLANILYAQLALHVQVLNEKQRVYKSLPPNEQAIALRTLTRRRYELERDIVRHENKLVAIADELFPELTEILKSPNSDTALRIRLAFPLPVDTATATIEDLKEARGPSNHPSNAKLARLQALAHQTIGTKNDGRTTGLRIEQRQLIKELTGLQAHCAEIDAQIERIVLASRQGTILLSLPGIGPASAGEIIAAIGNIANFENASKLRGYFGWCPVRTQTGESKNSSKLDRGGKKTMKKAMYLIVWRAIQGDNEFAAAYTRLVKSRCVYDPAKGDYIAKNRVIGRIAGRYIGVIYTLLKQDHNTLASLAEGEEAPPPALYDPAYHRAAIHSHTEG